MLDCLRLLVHLLVSKFDSRAMLEAENLVLRHQLNLLHRATLKRPQLTNWDRLVFIWLYRLSPGVLTAVRVVGPETIVRWHRSGFRLYWRWKSRPRGGRPRIPADVLRLIRDMSTANPLWGAPRIHGELLKLGIEVGQTTVAKYMVRGGRPPSQTWRTFLENHTAGIAAVDLFVVPTIGFRMLYVLIVLGHHRRCLMWFGVTAHPTAEWIARQITEAFPWEQAPRYLLRDRDAAYGEIVLRRLRAMGIRDRPTAPRSPWQNAYAERLIGSIRRECLDHLIVFGEAHLRRILKSYVVYYNEARTHLALDKDTPTRRPVQRFGSITARPILGGLHHQYCRI
jgi:transposase InsO family protein